MPEGNDRHEPEFTRRQLGLLAAGAALGAAGLRVRVASAAAEAVPAYKNAELPIKERIADLVARMTPEEKAEQLQMTPATNNRLGIPGICWWSEGLHGVSRADPATIFPQALAMAATWNTALVQQIAEAISDEARAMYRPAARYYGLTLWCPAVNMVRDPRWGRAQEAFGEDPHLAGQIGVAYVKGLQGDDPKYLKTAATPKHFAVHSQETNRFNSSFTVSDRDLREYYLPAFHACFVEGKAASAMAAHSGVNGVPCMVNGLLLTDILRTEWGFDGAVTTDWNSLSYLVKSFRFAPDNVHGVAAAVKAGVDVLSNAESQEDSTLQAFKQGLISREELDRAVTHNLSVRMRLGFFDEAVMARMARPRSVIGSAQHVALARRTACESIVLLQNEPVKPGFGFERLLPLDLRKVNSIAVLGPFTEAVQLGDYTPKPANPTVSPLAGLKAAAGPRVKIETADWNDVERTVSVAGACDVAVVVMGRNEREATEGVDAPNLLLPGQNVLARVVAANPLTILALIGCNPMGLDWVKQNVPAALIMWFAGEQGGTALADVIFGTHNPAGRLPMTFYQTLDDLPPLSDYQLDKGRTYMYHAKPVPFVFGHGLSYTTFEYKRLQIEPIANGVATVRVDVANTGAREGDEVVQMYVHKPDSSVSRPIKQLKGFRRLTIAAGKTATVEFALQMKEVGYWDAKAHDFVVEPGTYEIQIGASSSDIRLRGTVVQRG